jgi:hypothetical protein
MRPIFVQQHTRHRKAVVAASATTLRMCWRTANLPLAAVVESLQRLLEWTRSAAATSLVVPPHCLSLHIVWQVDRLQRCFLQNALREVPDFGGAMIVKIWFCS